MISEKNILETDFKGKNHARTYLAKKIPTLKIKFFMVYNDGKKIFTVVYQEKNKQNHPCPPQKSQGRPLNTLQIVKVTTGYNFFFFFF